MFFHLKLTDLDAPLIRTIHTTSVRGLLHEIIPTIPDATTCRQLENTAFSVSAVILSILYVSTEFHTYKEASPKWTRLPHTGRGGEGHAGEGEGQDHGPEAQVAQPQVEEQPGPPRPPARHAPAAV